MQPQEIGFGKEAENVKQIYHRGRHWFDIE
jgi:hypothetical protein